MRSRGRSLPRSVCFLRAFSSPPSAALACWARRSATSFCMWSRLARYSLEFRSRADFRVGMEPPLRSSYYEGKRRRLPARLKGSGADPLQLAQQGMAGDGHAVGAFLHVDEVEGAGLAVVFDLGVRGHGLQVFGHQFLDAVGHPG